MGKGKKESSTEAYEHRPVPIASLKNPEAFGPPPKRVDSAAIPSHVTPTRVEGGEGLDIDAVRETDDESRQRFGYAKETSVGRKVPPPIPYRAKSTGDLTTNAPKPSLPGDQSVEGFKPKPKPSLPPRLPPRQISVSPQSPASPPPAYSTTLAPKAAVSNSYLNHGSIRRLGLAGITVPGLGIEAGSRGSSLRQADDGNSKSGPSPGAAKGLDKPNSQLPKNLDFSSVQKAAGPGSPSQGTTLAQKKAALKTATAFRKDPSSISLADAKATASTLNNFRERHGDQVASGMKSANALNQKYDISSKLAGHDPSLHKSGDTTSIAEIDSIATTPSVRSGWTSANTLNQKHILSHKSGGGASNPTPIKDTAQLASPASNTGSDMEIRVKRPPPPPPKKNISSTATSNPPPIPLNSKPKAY